MAQIAYKIELGELKYNGERLIICGDKSIYIPQSMIESYKLIFNNFNLNEVVILKNTGHFMHLTTPHEVSKQIEKFLI